MNRMNPRLTNKGSSPSPGAHLGEIIACYKAQGRERRSKVVKAGTRRRMNGEVYPSTTRSTNSSSGSRRTQTRTGEGQNREALDQLIDSITRDFSRKEINSRLKALATKSTRNATTICEYIFAE
jgi:hypothetical protein